MSGSPFQADEPVSAAKLNQKTITYTTNMGAEVQLPGQIFYNMANNGSFLKDDVVARDADGQGFKFLTMQKHTHDSNTNQSGGTLKDIFAKNLSSFLWYNKRIGIALSDFMNMGSGGSATLDHPSGSIKLDTSTGTNNYRNLHLMGIPVTFTKHSIAETVMQFTGAITNQFARWGFGLEALNLSNDSTEKYGIESCAATNGNWFVVTADGSSRTQQDSLKPLLGGGTEKTYRIENNVGISVDFTYSTDAAVSKTTNLPDSTSVAKNNIVNYGVKTTNTSSKQLFIHGLAVVGEV